MLLEWKGIEAVWNSKHPEWKGIEAVWNAAARAERGDRISAE
jgi:hypothetical protein